jgi:hypothetical protein
MIWIIKDRNIPTRNSAQMFSARWRSHLPIFTALAAKERGLCVTTVISLDMIVKSGRSHCATDLELDGKGVSNLSQTKAAI